MAVMVVVVVVVVMVAEVQASAVALRELEGRASKRAGNGVENVARCFVGLEKGRRPEELALDGDVALPWKVARQHRHLAQ